MEGDGAARGRAHGAAFAEEIRGYAADRIRLAHEGTWAGRPVTRGEVLRWAEDCVAAHEAYSPDLAAELAGMSDATGLSVAELVVVGGFTDFVDLVRARAGAALVEDACTAVIVPDGRAGGAGFLAQTWDMHDSAAEHVVMTEVRPDGRPAALVFTTVGCVGQIGMNEAGIAVGINNLTAEGQVGVTWPFVVREALAQTDIDAALACITNADLAGAHNYLLADAGGRGYSVEAMPGSTHVTELAREPLVHTNHCLFDPTAAEETPRPPDLQASSERRRERAGELLASGEVDAARLMALTRDQEAICQRPTPPYHIASCGAAIMRPRTRELWAVAGLPTENEYEHFTVTAAA